MLDVRRLLKRRRGPEKGYGPTAGESRSTIRGRAGKLTDKGEPQDSCRSEGEDKRRGQSEDLPYQIQACLPRQSIRQESKEGDVQSSSSTMHNREKGRERGRGEWGAEGAQLKPQGGEKGKQKQSSTGKKSPPGQRTLACSDSAMAAWHAHQRLPPHYGVP